jgi:hypothetical protein
MSKIQAITRTTGKPRIRRKVTSRAVHAGKRSAADTAFTISVSPIARAA